MRGPEPISPELALVAPDLGEAARRALPDRPWEQFAPPPARKALRVAPLPEPLHRPAPSHELARRRFVTGGRVVTAAALGFLVISCFLPPRGAPRLVTAPTPQPARAETTPNVTTFQAPLDREPRCTTPTGGSRDPFHPVCPPVTKR